MDLEKIISGKGWFVITATRESVGPHYAPANVHANDVLKRHLDALGLAYIPCEGNYKGTQQGPSYFVIGDEATARLLCDLYRQESVLVPDGLMDATGRRIAVCEGHLFGAQAFVQDFCTQFGSRLTWSAKLRFI